MRSFGLLCSTAVKNLPLTTFCSRSPLPKTVMNYFNYFRLRSDGQALVTLLIFVATALIVTSAAIAISIINIQATSQFSQGQQAYDLAEAGVEDAIMKLVRNASFDSPAPGYTLTIGTNTAQIIVTPPGFISPKTIVSRGVVNQFKRKLQVVGQFNSDGTFSVVSWNEIDD